MEDRKSLLPLCDSRALLGEIWLCVASGQLGGGGGGGVVVSWGPVSPL